MVMVEIDFSMDNIKKCLCTQCHVQLQSQCVRDKEKILLEITMQDLDSPMMMGPDRVPGLYCSTGKAVCKDIDTSQVCRCNECPLWREYELLDCEPMAYFCRDGKTLKK
jgi:hypothetical protein